MKKFVTGLLIFFSTGILPGISQVSNKSVGTKILIETGLGNITLLLYNETPFHHDNFVKLVKEGYFNGQLFHRVIKDFMIQGGDPNSKNAGKGEMLGLGGPRYVIPAEIRPKYYHKRGALAAARKGDEVNPEKSSSGSQFYIVQGEVFTQPQLNEMVKRGVHIPFTPQQVKDYTTIGGSPHLDGSYTVFGEVLSGIDVVGKIANLPADAFERPVQDIKYVMKVVK